MTWTLTGTVVDAGGSPVRDAPVTLRPTRLPTASDVGTITEPLRDHSDRHGHVTIAGVLSLPGHTWRLDIDGTRWTLPDPGDGATVRLEALATLPPAPTTSDVSALLTALSSIATPVAMTVTDGAVVLSMSNGTTLKADLPSAGESDLAALDAHVHSPTPHQAYDDIVDLTVLYRSRTA